MFSISLLFRKNAGTVLLEALECDLARTLPLSARSLRSVAATYAVCFKGAACISGIAKRALERALEGSLLP